MKKAIIALDGGGSNLRMILVDQETEEKIYLKKIDTGTNLSTVPNREEALRNVRNLIIDGFRHLPLDYAVTGIGLSSAGTEIKEDKEALEGALAGAVAELKEKIPEVVRVEPKLFVTNDIDILLHSSDIALVAGTGVVAAVKYKDINPYDNAPVTGNEEEIIDKLDGAGPYLGDKGAGYWIAKEVLTKVGEIETLGGYVNSNGDFIEESDSYLRELVLRELFKANNIDQSLFDKANALSLKSINVGEYVSLVYAATTENGRPFDRAKVGRMFSALADEAAYQGDTVANDILLAASKELFKNVKAAYQIGDFEKKPYCDLLLSGSVLTHSDITRFFLENRIREEFPNMTIRLNKEEPVMSTVKYVKGKLEEPVRTQSDNDDWVL